MKESKVCTYRANQNRRGYSPIFVPDLLMVTCIINRLCLGSYPVPQGIMTPIETLQINKTE